MSRTSKKQLHHIAELIQPWAGLKHYNNYKPVVWSCPEDVTDEIAWRGLAPFGDEREWGNIPYPEAKGLARLATQELPDNPVSFIYKIFGLKRRHEKTLKQFQSWIDEVKRTI